QVLQRVFGDGRQWPVHAEDAGAMAHGVELEIAEGDVFHLAIGTVVIDKIFVAAETVARMEHGRMLVGSARELIEAAACQGAEPIEMRLELAEIAARQIKRQQVAQAAVERIEIQARAVGGDGSRGTIGIAGERCLACARIHGGPRRKSVTRSLALPWPASSLI